MSKAKKPYSLVPAELPEAQIPRGGSMYDQLLDDFVKKGSKTVRLEYADKSINALMAGVRSRIKTRALNIRVVLRKGRLYLTTT